MTEWIVSRPLVSICEPRASIARTVLTFTPARLASLLWSIPTKARAARNWFPVVNTGKTDGTAPNRGNGYDT